MISYCIACYRPRYSELLIGELIRKTSTPFEILLWLNVDDASFNQFLGDLRASGAPIRILGSTPHNIGMDAYFRLFEASQFDMVTQIDDDVICISPGIAEKAATIFERFSDVGMLTADVWQDEFTTGARPPLEQYSPVDRKYGLYAGPIDGWFAVYRKRALQKCRRIPRGQYIFIGGHIHQLLPQIGMRGLLCTRMRVFHVIGPHYVSYFKMLDFEIQKYSRLGRTDIVRWYSEARSSLPAREELHARVEKIRENLAQNSGGDGEWNSRS